MQFKPKTLIAVLLLVVASLLVSGCTSSTTATKQQAAHRPRIRSLRISCAASSDNRRYRAPASDKQIAFSISPVVIQGFFSTSSKIPSAISSRKSRCVKVSFIRSTRPKKLQKRTEACKYLRNKKMCRDINRQGNWTFHTETFPLLHVRF